MMVSIKWRSILCVDSSSHGHCNFKSAQIFSPPYRYGALTDIILYLRRQCPCAFPHRSVDNAFYRTVKCMTAGGRRRKLRFPRDELSVCALALVSSFF